jgi:hypothetical protein
MVNESKRNIAGLKALATFQHVDEHLIDRGEEIRRLAESIVELLRDDARLKEYRRQADKKQFLGFAPLTNPSKWSLRCDDWESEPKPIPQQPSPPGRKKVEKIRSASPDMIEFD